MMMITAMILATGPWIDSSIDWSGASHGIDDPAAWAGADMARVTNAPSASVEARARKRDRAWVIGSFLVLKGKGVRGGIRSEEHTSELQSLLRISYAVFCLKKKKK